MMFTFSSQPSVHACFILLMLLARPYPVPGEDVAGLPAAPPLEYDFSLRTYGADIDVNFGFLSHFTGSWTQLHTRIGGGWQQEGFHRNPDGSLFFADEKDDIQLARHNRIETGARIGVVQGISWNEQLEQTDWRGYVLVGSSYEFHIRDELINQLIFETDYQDNERSLTNRIATGALRDRVHKTEHKVDGFNQEISLEYGPWWLGNRAMGAADYVRLHARHVHYVPLFTDGLYLVNGTYIDRLWGGWAEGTTVPLNARASFGGWKSRSGLGDTARGFESGRFDADFKLANAMDIRYRAVHLESLNTRLGILGYWDIGYYRGLRDAPEDSEYNVGWVSSNGIAASITVLDTYTLVLYSHLPWFGTITHADSRVIPFAIDFGFHQ